MGDDEMLNILSGKKKTGTAGGKTAVLFMCVLLTITAVLSGCGGTSGEVKIDKKTGEAIIKNVSWADYKDAGDTNNRVFYEIFVGSFSDSDGDGTGDLRGIINRLDYLNDGDPKSGKSLGVEGIWLTPIFKSPSYHKYDVTDYYTIDEKFGTMDDLKELVTECHKRDIKVILDLVLNHTGNQNEWFGKFSSAHRHDDVSDEYYDFYCYSNSAKVGNRTFHQIPSDDEFYEGNFSPDMPELNYDNEKVRQAVLDIAKYYLNDVGVDGFRFDAAKYMYYGEVEPNVEFWTWYMEELKKIKPDIYCVAEVWDSDAMTGKYAGALRCFDFTMAQTDGLISSTVKLGDVNKYNSYVDGYIDIVSADNPDNSIVPFIANHDTDRAAGYMTVSSSYAKVAANLYILGPGSPFIYYGEEIGIKGSRGGANTDANRRLKMLWGDEDTVKNPVGTTFEESKQTNGTVESLKGDENSLYNYYKRLIMIRKANPEIARGEYTAIMLVNTKMGCYTCTYNQSTVAVFQNTGLEAVTVDLSTIDGLNVTRICDYIGMSDVTLDGTKLTVGAQTAVIMR